VIFLTTPVISIAVRNAPSMVIGGSAIPHGIANPALNQESQLKLTKPLELAVNPFSMGFAESDPDLQSGAAAQR